MRLKLDENLPLRAALLLHDAGHDVATVADQQIASASDRELIGHCGEESRCLVTLDLDFANPLVFVPSEYAGIAVFRLPARASPEYLFSEVRTLIRGLNQSDVAGRLWIVERGSIREYRAEDE